MTNKWAKVAVVVIVVLLPFLIREAYRRTITALPSEIVIATGPPDGQFRTLMASLAEEIKAKHNINVTLHNTNGSVDNLLLLRAGKVDFAPSQAGTLEAMERLDPKALEEIRSRLRLPSGNEEIAFVANLFLSPAHLLVRQDTGIESPVDLRGKVVSLGVRGSGTYSMSLVLFEHLGLDRQEITPKYLDNLEVKEGFLNNTLDAAFITSGVQSPVFADLFQTGRIALLGIPNTKAFATNYVSMYEYEIPSGLYSSHFPLAPPAEIHTVAVNTQLLARTSTNVRLVEEVTKIVLSEEFQRKNQLQELFAQGREFAQERPEFAIHKGALRVYTPEPGLFDPDFVDVIEKSRSFIFSSIIAVFMGIRWLRRRREKRKAHKLDDCMRRLLDIEQRHLSLPGNELQNLEKLLTEVSQLRHEALQNFFCERIKRGSDGRLFPPNVHWS